jgi:hypothetical protein
MEMERYIIGRQTFPHGKVWSFRCPTCNKLFSYGEPGEPMCTGPDPNRDDHEPIVMLIESVKPVGKNEKFAPPGLAEERAKGALYIPGQGLEDGGDGDDQTED